MKATYEFSIGELKCLIELIQELARRSGLDEVVSSSLLRRLNEKHFR